MRLALVVVLCAGCTTVVNNIIVQADGGSDGAADLSARDNGVEDLSQQSDLTGGARDLGQPADLASMDLAQPSDLITPPDLMAPPDLVLPPDMTLQCGGNAVPTCNANTHYPNGTLCCNAAECINGDCWNPPGGYCCIDNSCNPIVACWQSPGVATGVCLNNHTCQ